jgi:hypothetical protein
VIVMEDIAAEDWYEQLIATVVRVKATVGYSNDKQDELIKSAETVARARLSSDTRKISKMSSSSLPRLLLVQGFLQILER